MKIIRLLIIVLGIANNLFGQVFDKEKKVEFFNLTFKDYFTTIDSTTNHYYVLKDSLPDGIKTDYDKFKIHFITYPQAFPLIRKKNISALYKARCTVISKDTVDIVIWGWSVDFKRVLRIEKINGKKKIITKNYNFAVWCRGTLGYIPQGRFVYASEAGSWNYITEKSIVKNKLEDYKLK